MPHRITLKILPRSSCNMIVGDLTDPIIKIKITAAPVDGEANKKLLAYLSKEWKIPKSKLKIVKGSTSRTKILEILD